MQGDTDKNPGLLTSSPMHVTLHHSASHEMSSELLNLPSGLATAGGLYYRG